MAVIDGTFTVNDRQTNVPAGEITLRFDEASLVVSVASGTFRGATIEGLSTFNNTTNTLFRDYPRIQPPGGVQFSYYLQNISVRAGGTDYNIVGGYLPPAYFPDSANVTASDGSTQQIRVDRGPGGGERFICFVSGTRIKTARGEVAVEDLQVGDAAVTASGALRSITWIGNRHLDCGDALLPFEGQPVRIAAGAFSGGLPRRPLYLSPGHPVLVGADADNEGGVLVPVMCLENGTTIAREPRAAVTYWHVELDAHDILLAEGLAAESYHDMGSRAWFAGEDGALINPEFIPADAFGRCRPVAVDGKVVEAERLRLSAVFAGALAAQCEWPGPEVDVTRWL